MAEYIQIKRRFSIVEREELVDKAQRCLWTNAGKPGLDYLISERGLSEKVIKDFQLGYIPGHVSHQLARRIIFPLFDPSGNLITVSSRNIDNKKSFLPVYWHESYEKQFYLYGIRNAQEAMRKFEFALVVEGQFDVLQLHNHGVYNSVGLSGNKMSEVQVSVIHRYCREIVVLLDVDENQAGQRGAEKIEESGQYDYCGFSLCDSDKLSVARRSVVLVTLPENSDPDSFIRCHGIGSLKNIVKGKRHEFHSSKLRY